MIRLSNLTRKFGDFTAVDDLSLEVPAGQLFCFLGPNGAGKTTTIKMMTGLLAPTTGKILINGHDTVTDPLNAKKNIGYIPDTPFMYERLTAAEFFAFTGNLYDIPDSEIRAQLEPHFELFGLMDHMNSLVKELSHGLRQRLLYASIFLHNPGILLIDEPLIGLDPYSIRLIKDLLIRKARSGSTIFLTTHILALAEDIADRIGIISRGRLTATGTLDELKKAAPGSKNLEEAFLKLTGKED